MADPTGPLGVPRWAALHHGRDAVIIDGARHSFGQLYANASRGAQLLADLGVGPGARVGLAMRNRIEYLEINLAAWLSDAVMVPFAYRSTSDELDYLVKDAAMSVLFMEDDGARSSTPVPTLSWGEWKQRIGAYPSVAPGAHAAPLVERVVSYTSGTTGRPKSLRRNDSPDGSSVHDPGPWLEQFPVDFSTGIHLCVAPMYHAQPRLFTHAALDWGHTVVMMRGFDAATALELIERERVTSISMAPIHFVRILKLEPEVISSYDLSSVRFVVHSASPVAPALKRQIIELFPNAVWEMYGGTEGTFTIIGPDEWLKKPGSVGRSMPGRDISILDEAGNPSPPGVVGRVFRHEPDPARRFVYADAPDATADAWQGEWFTIGEMGYLDEDQYLFLTDRVKDIIVRGGVNISSSEVEAVLTEHPDVQDAAVIGMPDDDYGEAVLAIVEARGAIDTADVLDHCRSRLASGKCPSRIDVVETLPREPTGKLRKRVLRELYWKAAGRAI
ncbi:AMP-binding protein [Mycobacterium sp. DL440]|uniref:AMP-binding protein n=1 Tax=Mycobacterium sp. DL440 TaxID=2675523 RepID=UPI0014207907|nr:AMP-binding protein [Mycobacterium sp. DL440]